MRVLCEVRRCETGEGVGGALTSGESEHLRKKLLSCPLTASSGRQFAGHMTVT